MKCFKRLIYNKTFFETIDLLISKKISIIIEAAFQHKLWQPKFLEFINKADVRIIICKTNTELTKTGLLKGFQITLIEKNFIEMNKVKIN